MKAHSLFSPCHEGENDGPLCVCVLLSCVQLFATPWTVVLQLFCPWNSPGKNTGVSGHSLLYGILPVQGSSLGLPFCSQNLYHLSHLGSLDLCEVAEFKYWFLK